MEKRQKIKNLDALEKEIYRLQLEAQLIENKIDNNVDHFRKNFPSMLIRSVFHCKSSKENSNDGFLAWLLRNDIVNSSVKSFGARIADQASKGIQNLLERLFQKKK